MKLFRAHNQIQVSSPLVFAALRVSTCGIGIAACCSSLAINHHPIIRSYRTTGVNEPSRASYRFAKARSLQQTWQYLSRVIARMHKLIVTVTAWASSPSSPRPSRPQHAALRIDIQILGRAKGAEQNRPLGLNKKKVLNEQSVCQASSQPSSKQAIQPTAAN